MNSKTYILLAAAIAVVITAMYGVGVADAASSPQIIVAAPTTIIYTPGTPVYNPYAPGNLRDAVMTYLPLALYNPLTGQW